MTTYIRFTILALLLAAAAFATPFAYAQEGSADEAQLQVQESYHRAKVLSVFETETTSGYQKQELLVEINGGEQDGDQVTIENIISGPTDEWRQFQEGNSVIITETVGFTGDAVFYVLDFYRLPMLLIFLLLFFVVALLVAGKKGAAAIGGLALSVFVLMVFIVPQIASGQNPVLIGGVGAIAIAAISLYMAHGWHRSTTVALAAMLATILLTILLAWVAVSLTRLFGVGSEAAYSLQFSASEQINLRGLLLTGIIIGALGVLDDVTTALVATVREIHHAHRGFTVAELYKRGLRVGLEHIASLINTLVFAYAGGALPLLLLFSIDYQPFWVTLNGQFLAEEIVRTLVGSTGLILAVPLTTILAAWYYGTRKPNHKDPDGGVNHTHN